jgi:hypothetical protein
MCGAFAPLRLATSRHNNRHLTVVRQRIHFTAANFCSPSRLLNVSLGIVTAAGSRRSRRRYAGHENRRRSEEGYETVRAPTADGFQYLAAFFL